MRAKLKEQLFHLKMRSRDPKAKTSDLLVEDNVQIPYFKAELEDHGDVRISMRMETMPLVDEHKQCGFAPG